MPILAVATYNDDGTVNVMALHEASMTVEGDLACCIGEMKKTHENIEKRRAFTVSLVNRELLAAVDYFGTVSGCRRPINSGKPASRPSGASMWTPPFFRAARWWSNAS